MNNWPRSLIREIAERRCIIIMGAGVSAGCKSADGLKSPPDWESLLHNALSYVADTNEKNIIADLISKQKYLDAAEIIRTNINPPDFRDFVHREFQAPAFQPCDLQKIIYDIDTKTVITTNHDTIYEQYCNSVSGGTGYSVCKYYETHALNDIRSATRLIIKAHGCIVDPQKLVLTRSSYVAIPLTPHR